MSVGGILGQILMLHAAYLPMLTRADVLVDPTRPPVRAEQEKPAPAIAERRSWALESTLVSPERRVAVINGKLVSEGESVDGARVIAIRKRDVLLSAQGRRMTLQLLPDIVKE